jgi:phosphatidylserine/phosphatidylglycerophosphate/cardiolipin synthase-like enzyme
MQHAPATRGNYGAGRACTAAGIHIHYVTGNRLLHAKTCIIDKHAIWIGSGNFTAAAAHHNHEAYLRADCAKIAAEIVSRWEALT